MLDVGDAVFAHVRSYPWWPARIVGIKKTTKSKKGSVHMFSVVFYGTEETANLPDSKLCDVTPETVDKCETKGALRRRNYKEGF